MLTLTRLITDRNPRTRERGAEECADYISSYSSRDVHLLCALLTMCATVEEDITALESQLHALIELGSTGHVRHSDLAPLSKIDRAALPTGLDEYIEDLLEE
ncbi:hypothetical protein TPA0909_11840 [Streptomyces albus]|nr:hypothetical protein TPA0909_11790 [Streptomyces albus]GHJ19570.1 hypothetical protein TPA0909_11840 [Streptomyces albus]